METQVRIKSVVSWTFPTFNNVHTMSYGKLEVTDGKTTKICKTKGDTLDTWHIHQCQYITFNRKPYKVCGHASLAGVFNLYLEPIN